MKTEFSLSLSLSHIYIYIWWLSIGSDDDVCILQLIYEHGGGSAAPAQRHSLEQWGHWKSVVVITAETALRCLSLAAVSFWHWASSKLAAALWTEPHHFGLSMAYPSRSLGLMWPHWRLALIVSLYHSFGLPWFLLLAWSSPYIRRLSIQHSSIWITCPTHRSWALMMVASILVDLAWSRTFRLVMWSCHLIPRMERRARMWKSSSFLICLQYSVHVSQP